MENILNKKIRVAVILLLVILSLFIFVLFINGIKSNKYIGRSSQSVNTILVSGTGEVLAVSDIAVITVNLTKDGKTTKEAQDLLNVEITKTLKYLKDQNIADKDIKSEYGGLNPKYSYSSPGIVCMSYPCPPVNNDPKIVGYTATESVTIKVRAVDSANDIRTGLANLGITDISGPTFSIDNEDSFKVEARAFAIKDAQTKALVLAKELGVHLGSVANFSENTGGGYPIMYTAKAMSADNVASSAPAPILPTGENKITSNVTITYEIR